jgi:uncharacterized protein
MQRFLSALLAALSLLVSAHAADAPVEAHPALWKVTGAHSTVYLLGSVHVLSPDLKWRDARIDKAIKDADGYFFEVAIDAKAISAYVADRGMLPAGQSLRAMLPPESQKDLDDDIASLGVPEANIDTRRPWLATIVMTAIKLAHEGDTPAAGVDVTILADAEGRQKPIRYFETVDQQMALLAPSDPKVELEAFELFLKEFRTESEDIGPLVDAWAKGDQKQLMRLLFHEFKKHPGMRKALFDDRNYAWARMLESVLDNESGTFLVTVGAGHLLSDNGVPAILRRAGYKVVRL